MYTETQNKQKLRLTFISFSLLLLFTLTACSSGSTDESQSAGSSLPVQEEDTQDTQEDDTQANQEEDNIVIQVSDITETAQFYPAEIDGTNMEIVAVKASDGTIRTAFNTCQICNGSPLAYFVQSGDTLECQNCKNKFSMDKVEIESGGCNPVPIFEDDKTVSDDTITIPYETLSANTSRFSSNWKQ